MEIYQRVIMMKRNKDKNFSKQLWNLENKTKV